MNARRVALGVLLLWLGGCASAARFEYRRLCMGVVARVVVYAPDEARARAGAQTAFAELERLDAMMSDYRTTSELSRLPAGASDGPAAVSPELAEVLRLAAHVSEASGGAFDVTVGPSVALWREARRTGRWPDDASIARARALVDHRRVRVLDGDLVRIDDPRVRLDLGGIAKGFAVERAATVLRRAGLPRCLVALAGDVYAGDPPPGRDGWRVEVRGERSDEGTAPVGVLRLARAAASTSGDAEQLVEIDGRRASHLIDPRTGEGSPRRVMATVVADRGAEADALATAAALLDPRDLAPLFVQFPRAAGVVQGPEGAVRIGPSGALRWEQPPR